MDIEDHSDWYSNEISTFGDRVAGARDALGLSQNDLARKLGVKVKTIRGWENDMIEPRANKLQMLSGLLGVSLMWLLNGEGDGVSSPEDDAHVPADIQDVLSDMRSLRLEIDMAGDRLARLEKRLRQSLSAGKSS